MCILLSTASAAPGSRTSDCVEIDADVCAECDRSVMESGDPDSRAAQVTSGRMSSMQRGLQPHVIRDRSLLPGVCEQSMCNLLGALFFFVAGTHEVSSVTVRCFDLLALFAGMLHCEVSQIRALM